MILCVETSQDICSVALFNQGQLLSSKESTEKNSHNKLITILIQETLTEASVSVSQLQAAMLSSGPGSYTGLRVGSSALKGLCYGLQIPLMSMPSLQLIAYQASLEQEADIYIPMIDARRMEVFEQQYDNNLLPVTAPRAYILDEKYISTLEVEKKYIACGNGAIKLTDLLGNSRNINIMSDYFPMARFMGKFALEKFNQKQFENLAYFEPFYLKSFGEKAANDI
jgi:tRNA threonylcarbamoyladenosine biosynthesis protein TsaB